MTSKEDQIKALTKLIKDNTSIITGFKTSIETLQKENEEALKKIEELEKGDKEYKEESVKIETALTTAQEEANKLVAEIQEVQKLLKKD